MKAPLTIIVPVYNRAHYIVRTLDSIAASTCMFSELLIVDNGSDDNTMEVCSQWADSHQDLSVCILSEKKRGAAAARNYGLLSCHSEYVYFFDSDDLFSRDFIASIYPELSQPFDVLCVPVRQNVNSVVRIRPYKACAGVHIHLLNNMLSTQSMVFRKSFLDQIGGWNESLTTWDDWELGTRVLLAHPRLRWYEGQAFHQVFVHQDSLTGESFSATLPAIIKAMQSVLHLIVHAKLTDDERKRAVNAYYLRCMIYGGHLRREGNRGAEEKFKALADKCVNKPRLYLRLSGAFLRWYSALGGRGAWRVAFLIINK